MNIDGNPAGFTVELTAEETRKWANRPGSRWPCSKAAGRKIWAQFGPGGLVDLKVDGRRLDPADGEYPDGSAEIPANEFNALMADKLPEKYRDQVPGL